MVLLAVLEAASRRRRRSPGVIAGPLKLLPVFYVCDVKRDDTEQKPAFAKPNVIGLVSLRTPCCLPKLEYDHLYPPCER
jgi:hypothetical protein